MIITTNRLLLRPITDNDTSDIFTYSKEDHVGPNAGWKPHESIEETRNIMTQIFLGKDDVFGIVLQKTGKLIGTIGLVDDPKRENEESRMLGYAIGEEYWNNGYMTEAAQAVVKYGFEVLRLELISAYCYPHNQRSKRVLNKLSFRYEGTLSLCEKLYNGEIHDNECYAMKQSEWHFINV